MGAENRDWFVDWGVSIDGLKCFLEKTSFLFSGHAFGVYFALNNFMGGLAAVHFEAGEFLVAFGAGQVAVGVVFAYAFDNAFDQAAVAAFTVFVEEGFAFGAEDGDGSDVFACHKWIVGLGGEAVCAIKRTVSDAVC